ncbi:AMP-binding protein [Paraburkholderia sp. BL25I1N1]|uniref:AMP-binding protein n=1 Tax=Paraburkholderia sp. BL25I1N1 TaxID=1938804 RepID=UPI000D071DAE|nr:AMP-binding protein [Paraburkholderia sp. BL25I1N1]PRY04113.1 AMP-binding enzyme [Paraburkholderia sp. BL25I1N1]
MYATQSLHRTVLQYPERIAARLAGRARCFREFVHRVAQLAGALQQLGMQEGDRVAMNFLLIDLSRSTP